MSQMAHPRRSRAIHRTKLWLHWRSASPGHGRQQWPQGEARLALRVRPLVALAQDESIRMRQHCSGSSKRIGADKPPLGRSPRFHCVMSAQDGLVRY
jgi:hypothetical protein